MYCQTCTKELTLCKCPNLEERLANIVKRKNMMVQMCGLCVKHYAVCKCEVPEWTTNQQLMKDGKL